MLHLNTIDETVHRVLLSLLSKKYLNDFSLVGRTSLSIRYGHRKSVDIYLFSPSPFEPSLVDGLLKTDYSDCVYRGNNGYQFFCDIGPVKTDIIHHPFATPFRGRNHRQGQNVFYPGCCSYEIVCYL